MCTSWAPPWLGVSSCLVSTFGLNIPHAPAPVAQGIPLGLQARGRFDATLRDLVDRLAKRFRGKVEIVNLLEVHPEIGT